MGERCTIMYLVVLLWLNVFLEDLMFSRAENCGTSMVAFESNSDVFPVAKTTTVPDLATCASDCYRHSRCMGVSYNLTSGQCVFISYINTTESESWTTSPGLVNLKIPGQKIVRLIISLCLNKCILGLS